MNESAYSVDVIFNVTDTINYKHDGLSLCDACIKHYKLSFFNMRYPCDQKILQKTSDFAFVERKVFSVVVSSFTSPLIPVGLLLHVIQKF